MMFKKDSKNQQQQQRLTPSKSMLSQIQSRIAQSRLKSRLTISRNTPGPDTENDRFLYKSMTKKDQKKIEPIANTYALPVPKIKLLLLKKKNNEIKTKTSEFLNSENTTFDDFKEYRVFNGPQVLAKHCEDLISEDLNKEKSESSKQKIDNSFFISENQSFSVDDSYIKQNIYDQDDSIVRVVRSPSFLSKSSFVSFIPFENNKKQIKTEKIISKPILIKNHTIASIPINKLSIYDEPSLNQSENDSFVFHESVDSENSSLFKQELFDKDDSFIRVIKSPSFLSGQSSIYSLISVGHMANKNNSKNKFSISQANSNKLDQYIRKYHSLNNKAIRC